MDGRLENLEKEYREAIYVVAADNKEITFRVGKIRQPLNALLAEHNAANFAFITAHNPRSNVLPKSRNEARQRRLKETLHTQNFKFLEGYGVNEREVWEKEQSCFVFDISLEKALESGRMFEQYAILYGRKRGNIELVWCLED